MKISRFICLITATTLAMSVMVPANAKRHLSQYTTGPHYYNGANLKAFSKKFCAIKLKKPMILITQTDLFKNNKGSGVTCKNGTYHLRYTLDRSDRGHALFNIDSPSHQKQSFDCDSKADIGMKTIALNCFLTSKETSGHRS